MPYQDIAIPTKLYSSYSFLEGYVGFEPTTRELKARCSILSELIALHMELMGFEPMYPDLHSSILAQTRRQLHINNVESEEKFPNRLLSTIILLFLHHLYIIILFLRPRYDSNIHPPGNNREHYQIMLQGLFFK